jgi:hypothetical protein
MSEARRAGSARARSRRGPHAELAALFAHWNRCELSETPGLVLKSRDKDKNQMAWSKGHSGTLYGCRAG